MRRHCAARTFIVAICSFSESHQVPPFESGTVLGAGDTVGNFFFWFDSRNVQSLDEVEFCECGKLRHLDPKEIQEHRILLFMSMFLLTSLGTF